MSRIRPQCADPLDQVIAGDALVREEPDEEDEEEDEGDDNEDDEDYDEDDGYSE